MSIYIPWYLFVLPLLHNTKDGKEKQFSYRFVALRSITGPLLLQDIILIPAWISNCIHYKVGYEFTYPFPHFNGATVEVWKWIRNFFPHFTRKVTLTEQFRFKRLTHNEVLTRLAKINVKISIGADGIPPKKLKIGASSFAPFLTNMINKSIDISIYPSDFKKADLSHVFKKDDNLNKLNFRPISLLKVMSKIHEGMLSEQLCDYFYGILADMMSRYSKKQCCQTLLLNMVKQWTSYGKGRICRCRFIWARRLIVCHMDY